MIVAEIINLLRASGARVVDGRIRVKARAVSREARELVETHRAEIVAALQAEESVYHPAFPEASAGVAAMLRGERPAGLDLPAGDFQNALRPQIVAYTAAVDGLRRDAALKLLKLLDDLHGSGQTPGHPFHISSSGDISNLLRPLLQAHLDGFDVNVDCETFLLVRRGQLRAVVSAGVEPWKSAASEVMRKLDQRCAIKG